MIIFSDEQLELLYKNGAENRGKDNIPSAYLSLMGTDYSWLLSELYHDKPTIGFGLYCAGQGIHIGEIDLEEVGLLRGPDCSNSPVAHSFTKDVLQSPSAVCHVDFTIQYPLSVYNIVANRLGYVCVEGNSELSFWNRYLEKVRGNAQSLTDDLNRLEQVLPERTFQKLTRSFKL